MLTAVIAATMASAMMNTQDLVAASWNRTHVVGHRGAAAYELENSLASFKKAVEVGAHASECDIHMSKDGKPMVIHDKTLDRTTDMKGVVAETLAADMHSDNVPTLGEYIDVLKDKVVQVIEIKDGKDVVPAVIKDVRAKKTEKQTIIFSFNAEFVKQSKELAPDVYAVWLVGTKFAESNYPQLMKAKADCKADALGFSYRNVEESLPKFLREQKCPMFVWTVPPGEEVERLKGYRVNFIITDHPKDVLEQLGF